MERVKGKIALVTGGSGGIGFETAKMLIQEGAKVIIADITGAAGKTQADTIGANYVDLDVSKEDQWQNFVNNYHEQYGPLDILFNNAGTIGLLDRNSPQNPEHISINDWTAIHQINLDGTFLGCKYGIQLMKERGGSIINMSSILGIESFVHSAAYSSSKAAVRNHTKTVAIYCAEMKYNIRCNSIHPGVTLTAMWDPIFGENEKKRENSISHIASKIPLGRLGTTQDVAYAVLYLASDESRYITGTELKIDGGLLSGSLNHAMKLEA
ncbi:MAG: SDR family oxidoreductase [Gammaproteobacteria bacterium]|nr:SDR family oxidoreductase [Gammaproteobacteria bacterium]